MRVIGPEMRLKKRTGKVSRKQISDIENGVRRVLGL